MVVASADNTGRTTADRRCSFGCVASADTTCRKTGAYQPGETKSSTTSDQAVRGNLWWSASNWRNRITVPLTFAPPANFCSVLDNRLPVFIYGSALMPQATTQWATLFSVASGGTFDSPKFSRRVRSNTPTVRSMKLLTYRRRP